MKVIITCNTTVLRDGISSEQAQQMRLQKRPQQEYKRAISEGNVEDVSEEQARLWISMGYAKAHPDDPAAKSLEPADITLRTEQARLTNQGQGAAAAELNLQHAEIAQAAHASVAERLNGAAETESPTEQPTGGPKPLS